MPGAFQTSRDIFENPIWQNIVEFRLFFLIYGKAAFVDGARIGSLDLKRGQWVRSIRNLQSDLEYIENRSIKKYSLSTIHRAVNNLVKQERIKTIECELGTLFEVVNYAKYQGFENYKNNIENTERTEEEQQQNSNETEEEQQRNNNNKTNNAKKINNANKVINISGVNQQSNKFIPPTIDEVKQYCIERNNNVDPEKFVSHYTASNWYRGKTKIKDWKACVITWEKNNKQKTGTSGNIFFDILREEGKM